MREAKLSAAPLHSFCGLVHISEMIFPQKNVRFIAINDGVDSAQGENDFAPLRNIFNESIAQQRNQINQLGRKLFQPPLRPAVPLLPGAYEARPLKKVVDATAWLW